MSEHSPYRCATIVAKFSPRTEFSLSSIFRTGGCFGLPPPPPPKTNHPSFVPKSGCFKPGSLQFLCRNPLGALLRPFANLHLHSFALICALLHSFACFCVRPHLVWEYLILFTLCNEFENSYPKNPLRFLEIALEGSNNPNRKMALKMIILPLSHRAFFK